MLTRECAYLGVLIEAWRVPSSLHRPQLSERPLSRWSARFVRGGKRGVLLDAQRQDLVSWLSVITRTASALSTQGHGCSNIRIET